jgi:predicted RNA-binding protein YlxR (DUF448 family)
VGCGRRAPKAELLRIAIRGMGDAREAVADPLARMPGRGAYLCRGRRPGSAEAACLALALRRGALGRALRATVSASPELVESSGG